MKKVALIALIALFAVASVSAKGAQEAYDSYLGMEKIVVLNNAFDGLKTSSQCYNAKEYHKCYNLGEIVEANFLAVPADDVMADTVAYTDFYTDSVAYKTFKGKYVSLAKDNEKYDYDLYVGPNQKESSDVKYKGFVKIAPEALVMVPEDGWLVSELYEYLNFATAHTYKVADVNGNILYVSLDSPDELEGWELAWDGDTVVVTNGELSFADPLYIEMEGFSPASAEEGVIYRATILNDAKGVYGVEAPYSENRAGTFYKAWAVADLFEKYGVKTDAVKAISWKDGYTAEYAGADFAKYYIAFQAPTAKGDQKDFFSLGKYQPRNAGVTNVGYYLTDNAVFAYVPEAGLKVADAFAQAGMASRFAYVLTYADGTVETLSKNEVLDLVLAADTKLVSIEAK